MSRPTDCRTDGARTSWPGRARRARASTACLALCVSLLAPAAGTAQARHKPATVRCVQGYCVTHFKVEITGSQATSWNEPQHQDGAADCYQVPYASGKGEQRIDFAATGLVEVTGSPGGAPQFEYLLHGKVHRGVGEGRADVSRSAHLYHHVIAGPCGANSSVGDSDTAHGCGTRSERWTFDLRAPNPREVGLLSDPVAASLGPIFDGCPLLATGILNVYDLQDLYGDFTERLPAGDIFNKGYGKLILLGSRHFAGKAPSRWNIRGDTQISWTVSMTRIAHSVFPFNPAPLR